MDGVLHTLACDEHHQHTPPRCCASSCWCRSETAPQRFRRLAQRVGYKDWRLEVVPLGHWNEHLDQDAVPWALRVSFRDDGERWTGRKWYLSPHMTDSEFFQTALLAVLTAEEHEARERFRVDGVAPYGPHVNVTALKRVSHQTDVRDPVA